MSSSGRLIDFVNDLAMMNFSRAEVDFILRNELCRLATVDENNVPHLVPICYIFHDGAFYLVTDLNTKKLKNISKNKMVALLIDVYKPNRAIMIVGEATVLYSGEEFKNVSEMFFEKFEWARRDRWDEGEAAMIKVIPIKKVSWGLGERGWARRR